jgi:hypothetical protein
VSKGADTDRDIRVAKGLSRYLEHQPLKQNCIIFKANEAEYHAFLMAFGLLSDYMEANQASKNNITKNSSSNRKALAASSMSQNKVAVNSSSKLADDSDN